MNNLMFCMHLVRGSERNKAYSLGLWRDCNYNFGGKLFIDAEYGDSGCWVCMVDWELYGCG